MLCARRQRRWWSRSAVVLPIRADSWLAVDAIGRALRGRKASLASAEEAAALTGRAMGTVPPLSFDVPRVKLIVDERLMAEPQIAFNAGRPDRSIFLRSAHYRRIAKPVVERIAG